MKRAILRLIKNGKHIGWMKVTPEGSTGILWRHIGNESWTDSSDIEIDFDESEISEHIEESL